MNYEQKYLKYKAKYVKAKQEGGLGGHLQVFFLTENQFTTIKNQNANIGEKLKNKKTLVKNKKDDYTNISYPGLGIHHHTNESGFKELFPYINEHEQKLHYKQDKKKYDVPLGKTKFDYYDKEDLQQVLDLIKGSARITDITKMILVRDYSLLHDVFVVSFTINKTGETVTGITIDPVTAE